MIKSILTIALAAAGLMVFAGCENPPTTPEAKQTIHNDVQSSLTQMRAQDPSLNDLLGRSYGYAIFPSVGKGGLIAGGAYGRGEVYQNNQLIGYAELQQGTIGLQAGGQEYAEVLVFQTRQALDNFKSGQFTLSGDISAVALKAGAAGSTQFKNGVAVLTMPKGGLMFEVSVGGQKFDFFPLDQNQPKNPGSTDHNMDQNR